MSNLGPQQQNQSFSGLLQIPGGVTTQLQQVQDGEGNTTGLWVSTTGATLNTAESFTISEDGVIVPDAVPRLISDGFGDYISALDFGAYNDGTNAAATTVALQNAIDACIAQKRALKLNGGTYAVNATLNISGSLVIFGDGRLSTRINYTGSSSAVLATNWTGSAQCFSVFVSNASANGFEITAVSRHASLIDIYLDATAVGSTTTGAGILLSTLPTSAFSGGLEIRSCYAIQFKYGVKMVGIDLDNTWTTVSMYNTWLQGNSAGIVSGSCGVYMDANTNGIGTCFYGGDIESFDTGVYVAEGSFGGIFELDFEGNVNNFSVGTTFAGRIVPASGLPFRSKTSNASGSGLPWQQSAIPLGGTPIAESYYPKQYIVYEGSGTAQSVKFYRNSTSVIEGGSLDSNALKFSFGLGQSGSYGIGSHPNDHYVQVADRSIHWDSISPAVRGNKAWVQGSVCYNSTATVGQPIGWMCTVSGTPGTWVAMANL